MYISNDIYLQNIYVMEKVKYKFVKIQFLASVFDWRI